jgi:hypothetical protein
MMAAEGLTMNRPRLRPRTLAAAAGVAVVFFGWWVWYGGRVAEMLGLRESPHQSDAALIETFRHHRAQFERLRQMLGEDRGLLAVDDRRTWPEDPVTVGVPASRIDQYRALMGELGLFRIAISEDRQTIDLIASSRGFVTHGSHKGYLYSTAPQQYVVADLDALSRVGFWGGLRHVEDGWYLLFEGD